MKSVFIGFASNLRFEKLVDYFIVGRIFIKTGNSVEKMQPHLMNFYVAILYNSNLFGVNYDMAMKKRYSLIIRDAVNL